MSEAVTRGRVLAAFAALPPESAITTLGVAWLLGCPEHRVRAAVSWLALGGLVAEAGAYPRRDRRGRTYRARLYTWTGREEIARVARDVDDRRRQREAEQPDDLASLARAWLARPLPRCVAGLS